MTDSFTDESDKNYLHFLPKGTVPAAQDGVFTPKWHENAENLQRIVVSRLVRQHVKGRQELSAEIEVGRKKTPEKIFRVNKLYTWSEGTPDEIIQDLREQRVRARVDAAMGVGKSTRLAPLLAEKLGARVLLVGLDAASLQDVAVYISDSGIGKIKRCWAQKRCEWVNCMSYADFNGYMMSASRVELFKSFEVIIFDEAFVNSADVFVAKRCFSAFSLEHNSLLLCSATMQAREDGEEVKSKSLGRFMELTDEYSTFDAMLSNKLISDYLVDRTLVLLPSDSQVHEMAAYYDLEGVDQRFLDSASSTEDRRRVCQWLEGDSTVPRVLVAHASYGIGYNLPVSFIIAWPQRAAYVEEDGVWQEKVFPVSDEMVMQMRSRTGRGIVDGSGGLIMSPTRISGNIDIQEGDEMLAFVKLFATSIIPKKSSWSKCYAVFPDGLTPMQASSLLKVCLPPAVAARYLGSDGRFSKKHIRALTIFAQPDHFPMAGCDELPVGYDDWSVEQVDTYGQAAVGASVRVPVKANGELQTLLHCISAISDNDVEIERWRRFRSIEYNDGNESPDELVDSRYKIPRGYRRVEDEMVMVKPTLTLTPASGWSYRAAETSDSMVDRRGGLLIHSDRLRDALQQLELSVGSYENAPEVDLTIVEGVAGRVAMLPLPKGKVESPGGTVICEIAGDVCEKINVGRSLTADELFEVVAASKPFPDRFAVSILFDNFSLAWDSILNTLTNREVVLAVVRKGAAPAVYRLVDSLRARFNIELCSVLAVSNIYKERFFKVFKRTPSPEKLVAEIRAGKFNKVAQSDGFIRRIMDLKEKIDNTLAFAEAGGVYLALPITNAQAPIPIRGNTPLGVVGEELAPMPKSVAVTLFKQGQSGWEGATFNRFD